VINNFAGGTTTLLAIMPCSSSKKIGRKALLGGRPAAGVHQYCQTRRAGYPGITDEDTFVA